jgi:hypothetical protein
MSDRYAAYMYVVMRLLRILTPSSTVSTSPNNMHNGTLQSLSVWHSLRAAEDELLAENGRIVAGHADVAWARTSFQRTVHDEVLDGYTFVYTASSTHAVEIKTFIDKVTLGDRCLGHLRRG